MPRLWTETIEAHRREVGEAIMHTTAALVSDHGLRSVTMSQIAEGAGIGRATLYKYFPDVESILLAWHERQIAAHLAHLIAVRDRLVDPGPRLAAVLEAYALIAHESRGHSDSELAAVLHQDQRVMQAERQLHGMISDLIGEGARTGDFRDDVESDELDPQGRRYWRWIDGEGEVVPVPASEPLRDECAHFLECIDRGVRLSPRDIFGDEYALFYAFAHFEAGRYAEAAAAARRRGTFTLARR